MEMNYENQAKVFKALCDEKRLKILELLRSGEKCGCVLVEKLDIPQSSLSYHMKILCDSTLVECRKEGKWTNYNLSKEGTQLAKQLLETITSTQLVSDDRCECKKERQLDVAH
jgi:ArsR family transcriptional regulator